MHVDNSPTTAVVHTLPARSAPALERARKATSAMNLSPDPTVIDATSQPKLSSRRLRLLELSSEIEDNPGELAFSTRIWAQLSLPYRDPGFAVPHWSRRNGDTTLTLSPGPAGYPHGVVARCLLTWMSTEAVRTRSRHLDPGPSLRAFLSSVGTYPSGANQRRVMDQLHRLSTTAITVETTRDQPGQRTLSGQNLHVAQRYELAYHRGATQARIELSEAYFEEVLRSPVPVLSSALGALGGSPMRLDLYVWLSYRMSTLQRPTTVSWKQLESQFGAQYRESRQFKAAFLKNLEPVKLIYPQAKVSVVDSGLRLHPSPTHVARPAHQRAGHLRAG